MFILVKFHYISPPPPQKKTQLIMPGNKDVHATEMAPRLAFLRLLKTLCRIHINLLDVNFQKSL